MIIAVDGPAASGKGTLARRVAVHYALPYLDTGALYRAVAFSMKLVNADINDPAISAEYAKNISLNLLDDERIRSKGVGKAASVVAKHQPVREALLEYQRNFATNERGSVLDGRDIGTVVCPDADVKLFITATPEERAKRRYNEYKIKGLNVLESEVLNDIKSRDARDMSRKVAPMCPAEDSHLLDTTNLDIEATFKAAIKVIDLKMRQAGCA